MIFRQGYRSPYGYIFWEFKSFIDSFLLFFKKWHYVKGKAEGHRKSLQNTTEIEICVIGSQLFNGLDVK